MKKTEIGLIPVSMGLFSMMMLLVIPGSTALGNDTFVAYGVATITQFDTDKNPVFTQSVHNQLTDQGEVYLLNQAFNLGGTDDAEGSQIGAICLSATDVTDGVEANELITLNSFNTAQNSDAGDAGAHQTCKSATPTISGSVVTIAPTDFTAGAATTTNWFPTDTVRSIGVCGATSDGSGDCDGTLLAVAGVGDTLLADGESVTVTYTFDLTSTGT